MSVGDTNGKLTFSGVNLNHAIARDYHTLTRAHGEINKHIPEFDMIEKTPTISPP